MEYIIYIISEITVKVLGPDEQPKSAMPMLSGKFLHNSSIMASSAIVFVIDIILLYNNNNNNNNNNEYELVSPIIVSTQKLIERFSIL